MHRSFAIVVVILSFGVVRSAHAQNASTPQAPAAADASTNNNKGAQLDGAAVTNDSAALKVQSAQSEAKVAKEEATEAKENFDTLKSGKLISSGLTGGLALAVQTPLGTVDSTGQKSSKAVAMPYLLVLPAYFSKPEAVRVYCASTWGSGSESTAQRAAIAIAKERAELLFDAVVSAIRAEQKDDAAIATQLLGDKAIEVTRDDTTRKVYSAQEVVTAIRDWDSPGKGDQAAKSNKRNEIIQWLAAQDWNPSLKGRCGWTKVGVWVGKPLAYDIRSTVKDAGQAERQFSSVVAFGLGYSPNAYFSILGGVTLGNIADVRDDNTKVDVPAWAGTVAIGGNLDLLGGIFK
jgi:hypothetical protein